MVNARLAQLNIAAMRAPIDSPLMADFAAELDNVNAQAENSNGFVWRLKDDTGNATTISASSPFSASMLVNLSVWESPEALKTFVYRQQDHAAVLKQRAKWFEPMQSPHFCMWWLREGELPTLADAKRRVDYLAEYGDSAYAFTFKKSFASSDAIASNAECSYLLRLADEALIHAQRISEWCGHGPILEEDLAFANVALDYLGQARLLYTEVGKREGCSRSEDDLAYLRNEHEFLNSSFVEVPNSSRFGHQDYALSITKLFLHSALMLCKWPPLMQSKNSTLAAVAEKSYKEARYHFDHASQWMFRFGDGTEESHLRAQSALEQLLPYCNEWFTDDDIDRESIALGVGTSNVDLKAQWHSRIEPIINEATLTLPTVTQFLSGGKRGYHTEALSLLLAEMQSLARQHPGAIW